MARSKASATKRPFYKRLLRWLGFSALGFFLASLAIVLLFRFVDPPTSAIALQRRAQAWLDGAPYQPRQCWRKLSSLGPNVALAVIASEDQRFATHWGLDLRELQQAAKASGRRRGASTITQQLAKNLLLWHGRSYVRKALEAYFAVLIEMSWSKARILEVYLNVVEFGPGVYGACAGAARSFQTEAVRMSPYQAALLAATLPNPHRRFAHQPTPQMHRRASWIVKHMQQLGGASYLAKL
jgi:monofunctional glycosyltransferase